MTHRGSCHCGRIAFTVDGDMKQLIECNCSLCSKRGSLLWFVPREQFSLETPAANLSTYTFNTHKIQHRFCAVCGCAPYAEANDPKGNPMAAVNARCLDGVDLGPLPRVPFDGRSR